MTDSPNIRRRRLWCYTHNEPTSFDRTCHRWLPGQPDGPMNFETETRDCDVRKSTLTAGDAVVWCASHDLPVTHPSGGCGLSGAAGRLCASVNVSAVPVDGTLPIV